MVLALVVVGIGVLLLIGVVVAVLPRVQRLSRAASDLRGGLERGRSALPVVRRAPR
ncbi:hypothetical protein GCM10017691_29950 [Pseudonocardia petroleophila]|uniref:Uncharacterized protein n=1 Tax=Pseudonocardia petroleophila TaxID=37331 RepID=A0A7G7MED8_9PSEU|nr:hypothetical protein [Pseudonocardia petroleophila]QNG51149.1 hypothetical protein H6H00_23720 [Pseudonocardia petroleophila]